MWSLSSRHTSLIRDVICYPDISHSAVRQSQMASAFSEFVEVQEVNLIWPKSTVQDIKLCPLNSETHYSRIYMCLYGKHVNFCLLSVDAVRGSYTPSLCNPDTIHSERQEHTCKQAQLAAVSPGCSTVQEVNLNRQLSLGRCTMQGVNLR
jgi:hypothetical protein